MEKEGNGTRVVVGMASENSSFPGPTHCLILIDDLCIRSLLPFREIWRSTEDLELLGYVMRAEPYWERGGSWRACWMSPNGQNDP